MTDMSSFKAFKKQTWKNQTDNPSKLNFSHSYSFLNGKTVFSAFCEALIISLKGSHFSPIGKKNVPTRSLF